MKTKGLTYIVLAVLLGIVFGSLCTELVLRFVWGSPERELEKNNLTYAYFEIYNRFFAKTRDKTGQWIYETQRINIDKQNFPVVKQPNTIRIFILGESTAYCFGQSKEQFLEILKKRMPKCQFEILNCGLPALDITKTLPVFKEIVNYSPDLILLFAGNNICNPEIEMPDKAGRLLYEKTWIFRLLNKNYIKDRTVYGTDPHFLNVHRDKLKEVAVICKRMKIPIVLFTLPANIKNFPMTHSKNPIPVKEYKEFFLAKLAMDMRNYNDAATILKKLIAGGQDKNIYVLFYLARCMEALNRYTLAKKYYYQVQDYYPPLSENPKRLCPPKNEITKAIAESEDVIMVDLVKMFMEITPHGLIGDECLRDYCHWWQSYNSPIFQEALNRIVLYNRKYPEKVFAPFKNLNYNNYAKMKDVMKIALKDYSNNADYYYNYAVCNIIIGGNGVPDQPIDYLKKSYPLNPALLKGTMKSKTAIYSQLEEEIWTESLASRVDKTWPLILWDVGEAFRQMGHYKLALIYFNKSIELKSDQLYPYLYRGLTYFILKEYALAERDWKTVISKDANYSWLEEILKTSSY